MYIAFINIPSETYCLNTRSLVDFDCLSSYLCLFECSSICMIRDVVEVLGDVSQNCLFLDVANKIWPYCENYKSIKYFIKFKILG